MGSPWKRHENEMSDVQTAEFAEPIRHLPMRRPDVNARAAPDPSRPQQLTCGIFEWQGHEVDLRMGHDATRMPPAGRISSRQPCVYVDRRDLVSDVRQDDRILVLELNVLLEVVDVTPDGQGRLAIRCNQVGRSKELP